MLNEHVVLHAASLEQGAGQHTLPGLVPRACVALCFEPLSHCKVHATSFVLAMAALLHRQDVARICLRGCLCAVKARTGRGDRRRHRSSWRPAQVGIVRSAPPRRSQQAVPPELFVWRVDQLWGSQMGLKAKQCYW